MKDCSLSQKGYKDIKDLWTPLVGESWGLQRSVESSAKYVERPHEIRVLMPHRQSWVGEPHNPLVVAQTH